MSIKVYNDQKQKWEAHSSTLAGNIKVLDISGKFDTENKNVESCLSEVKDNIVEMNKKVNYVYENGSFGDGPSTGGPIGPKLEIIGGQTEYVVSTTDEITLQVAYSSTNLGSGTITLSDRGKITTRSVKNPEVVYFTLPPFERNKDNKDYYVTIQATDAMGFPSETIVITVTSGALALESLMERNRTYLPGEEVRVKARLTTTSKTPVKVTTGFELNDPVIENVDVTGGQLDLDFTVTLPKTTNVYKAYIIAETGNLSTRLDIDLVVADSTTLLVATNIPQAPEKWETKYGQNLALEFSCYMLGQSGFNVDCYINQNGTEIHTRIRAYRGLNSWIIGTLELGEYPARMVVTTDDGLQEKELNFIISVTSANFTPHKATTNNLIAHFVSGNGSNESAEKNIWKNIAPERYKDPSITCELTDFNYGSNGWIRTQRVTELPVIGATHGIKQPPDAQETVLRFSGKSKAVINYAPFKDGLPEGSGFTFEIVYRTENTGDSNAKVVSCMEEPIIGFSIDTAIAQMKNNAGEQVALEFNENEWNRISFTVDRKTEIMKIYCNGVLTSFNDVLPDDPNPSAPKKFLYDGNIVLGAGLLREVIPEDPLTGKPQHIREYYDNFANCDIKSVRIYDRALTETEILDNYIADIKDEEEQVHLLKVNGMLKGFEMTIPRIEITTSLAGGDPDKSDSATVSLVYRDNITGKSKEFNNVPFKVQGTSSKDYPIKNYTFTLKENNQDYYGWSPREDWYPEATWTLKANYMDSSQANNVGAANFINDYFKPFPYPSQRRRQQMETDAKRTRTTVDGYPVTVWKNGMFHGIYTMNIDRYSYNNFGFIDIDANGVQSKQKYVCYEIGVNSSPIFDYVYTGYDKDGNISATETERLRNKYFLEKVRFDVKHRYNGYTNKPTTSVQVGGKFQEVLDNINNHSDLMDLLQWLGDCTQDEEGVGRQKFLSELKHHFSIPHLLRYFLICYVLGAIDSLGKNMTLALYEKEEDEGDIVAKWYPSFYDLDSILGVNNSGRKIISPGIDIYTKEDGFVDGNSKIWRWIYEDPEMFENLRNIYISSRTEVDGVAMFSVDNIMKYFGGQVIDTIGQKNYNEDARNKYLGLDAKYKEFEYMGQGDKRTFTEKWIRERLIFLDSVFEYTPNPDETNIVSLRSNKTGKLSLTVKTYSPQMVKLKTSSTNYIVKYADKDVPATFEWTSTNRDNDFFVSGADNIMELIGIKNFDVAELRVGAAQRITKLDLEGSSNLLELQLGTNKFLRELNVKNCTKLGSGLLQTSIKGLSLKNSRYLRKLLCSNTKIQEITLPNDGGVLEEFDASNTNITELAMTGQEYLKELNIKSAPKLNTLNINNCQQLQSIDASNSDVKNVNIMKCGDLRQINLEGAYNLQQFDVAESTNVEDINLSKIANAYIGTVKLTHLPNLKRLNIQSSSIRYLQFGIFNKVNFNKLEELDASYSLLTSIKYGENSTYPDSLDLAGLPLKKISFRQCTQLKEILNLNLDTTNLRDDDGNLLPANSSYIFQECRELTKITGKLKLGGSMNGAFVHCYKLTTLPSGANLDLSGVTSMTEAFQGTAINSTTLKNIMNSCSSKLTGCHSAFQGCPNITSIPFGLFSTTTHISDMSEMFYGCSNLTGSLPYNLLVPIGSRLSSMSWTFYNTKIDGMALSETATKLAFDKRFFEYNTGLTSVHRVFQNTLIDKVPNANLFDGQRNATTKVFANASGVFAGCSKITGTIPNTILHGIPSLTNVYEFFNGCSLMTGNIPEDMFNTNNGRENSLQRVDSFFAGCKGLTGTIPANLLAKSPQLQYVSGLFNGCSGLTGDIPAGLFPYNTSTNKPYHSKMIYMNNVFAGCSKLDFKVPLNIFKNKTLLQEVVGCFNGCTNLTADTLAGLFQGCVNLKKVNALFKNCRNLNCPIPEATTHFVKRPHPDNPEETITVEEIKTHGFLTEAVGLAEASELFSGCLRLQQVIPENLFFSANALKDISGAFYNCQRLNGWIPKGLLRNCTNLVNANNLFAFCCWLKDPLYDPDVEEHKYYFPKELFEHCYSLKTINSIFSLDVTSEVSKTCAGEIHPDSFINCNNLTDANSAFDCCFGLKGKIEKIFDNKTNFKGAQDMFWGTGITEVSSNLFEYQKSNTNLDLTNTFRGCTSLTNAFNIDGMKPKAKAGCFFGCTSLPQETKDLLTVNGWM